VWCEVVWTGAGKVSGIDGVLGLPTHEVFMPLLPSVTRVRGLAVVFLGNTNEAYRLLRWLQVPLFLNATNSHRL